MNNDALISVLQKLIKFLKKYPLCDTLASYLLWKLFDVLDEAAFRGMLSQYAVHNWFPEGMGITSPYRYHLYSSSEPCDCCEGGE